MSNEAEPNRKKYYVYTLVDTRENSIFYVGKGKGKRPFAHAVEARTDCDCKKCQRIRSVWDAGCDVRVDYVYETAVERDALLYEKELIASIGLRQLCNKYPGCISVQVKTRDDLVLEADLKLFRHQMRQDLLIRKAQEIEAGVLSPRQRLYWIKQIEANGAPLESKPPPWLKKIKE